MAIRPIVPEGEQCNSGVEWSLAGAVTWGSGGLYVAQLATHNVVSQADVENAFNKRNWSGTWYGTAFVGGPRTAMDFLYENWSGKGLES